MSDDDRITALFLRPGEMVLSEQPAVVTTLLGSCVAVTMYSRRQRVGMICHSLLPACKSGPHCSHGHSEAGKYVECAIRTMLERLAAHGVTKGEIEAKLFGGSDMFDNPEARNHSVGSQNIEMALRLLQGHSVRVVTQDLGGRRGRKIIFHTHTGEVFLKRLRKSEM